MNKRHARAGATATDNEADKALRRDSSSASVRPNVGDVVNVPGIGRAHVIAADDPSLLTCQTARGTTFRVGEYAVTRLEGGR